MKKAPKFTDYTFNEEYAKERMDNLINFVKHLKKSLNDGELADKLGALLYLEILTPVMNIIGRNEMDIINSGMMFMVAAQEGKIDSSFLTVKSDFFDLKDDEDEEDDF